MAAGDAFLGLGSPRACPANHVGTSPQAMRDMGLTPPNLSTRAERSGTVLPRETQRYEASIEPDRLLLWWDLILTGIGAALVLALPWWIGNSELLTRALGLDAVLLYGGAWMLAVCGPTLLALYN